jgi:hypothetical protein
MAITNRDMEFSEYGKELRTKIFAAYGMQPFVMGIVDETTGKLNSGQQVENYKDGALRPILEKEAYYYTQEIIKMGFGYSDLMVEFSALDLADLATQSELDRGDVEAGIQVINEVRERRGWAPVPWGDTPVSLAPGGGQVDPNTGRIIPPSEQQPTGAKPQPKKPQPKKDLLSQYGWSVKQKVDLIIWMSEGLEIPPIDMKKICHPRKFYLNSKEYTAEYYTTPFTLKNSKFGKLIDVAVFPHVVTKGEDPRYPYFECLASKIKFCIFDCIRKKKIDKISIEIDRILYEEKSKDFFLEIL